MKARLALTMLVLAGCAGEAARASSGDMAASASRPDGALLSLTTAQLLKWSPQGPDADPRNRSTVPLAPRFIDDRGGGDPRARILYAPDGMDNLGGYVAPQTRFNLYNFTHWAQIDILNWFAGSKNASVNIPARPWVEAAHRNGVKVIGTIFLAPVAWGGAPADVDALLVRDGAGRFPAAERLVALARYHGFDGWLVNAETDMLEGAGAHGNARDPAAAAHARATGERMRAFVAELKRLSPAPMEIIWYDAMLPDGTVRWQNALTPANLPFLQSGSERVSDGMFLNYQWTGQGLSRSVRLAEKAGRDRHDLFIGADLWPERDNAQPAFRDSDWVRRLRAPDGGLLGSIALFAPHFNYSFSGDARTPRFSRFKDDPEDVRAYYDTETRLFAGDDLNMRQEDEAGRWPGLSGVIPARSPLMQLPFRTSFNTGHGKADFSEGSKRGGPWHDMARQDVAPSWQFAFDPDRRVTIGYDFDHAYRGGSSLRVVVAPGQEESAIDLFLTRFRPARALGLTTVSTASSSRPFALRLIFSDGTSSDQAITPSPQWHAQHWCVEAAAGRRIDRIVVVTPGDKTASPEALQLNLGALALTDGCDAGNL